VTPGPRVVVTGASGQLGSQLVRAFAVAGATVEPLARPAFDLAGDAGARLLDALSPEVVVNAAAWTDVDGCAREPDRARSLNGTAAGMLASASERVGARFLQISTNEVFDGEAREKYAEDDQPAPINAYGMSKLEGERLVRGASPGSTIIRTAWIFGGPRSFPAKILAAARRASVAGGRLRVVADEIGNPTPAGTLARRIVRLALSESPPGVIHLAGEPPVSRYEWATHVLADAGVPAPDPIALNEYTRDSTPPLHAVLDTSLSRLLGFPPIRWLGRPDEDD
jgi:dTDP-4-dehydrorhamnose reductase